MKQSKQSSGGSKLLKGAALLGMAAIASKLLGTLQKIPLQNLGGDGVFGIYNTVYPFYTLLVTLATAGFPAAVSKFVAEREADRDERGAHEILRVSAVIMMALGIFGSAVLFFGASWLGDWIGSPHIIPALRAAAPALLFVPASAALRGFFQGQQNMLPTAVSQVVEQAVRVAVMIILLLYLTSAGSGEGTIAGGAMFGSAAGGAAGLAVMLLFWQSSKEKGSVSSVQGTASAGTAGNTDRIGMRQLLAYAVPICLAALASPLLTLMDTFTLPRLLSEGEISVMEQIGIYNRGIPLVQLINMMATSLSVLFIPAMAELKFKGDLKSAAGQAGTALRWFWMIGCAASVGLGVLAEPINIMLYKNSAGSDTLLLLAFTAAPAAMATVSAALLQGIGIVRAPALAMVLAAALKAALNVLLVPGLGISGAAIAGIAAYGLAAGLNMALLVRRMGLAPSLRTALWQPLLGLLAMAAAVLLLRLGFAAAGLTGRRLDAAAESVLGVVLGAAVFLAAALRLRLITGAELEALPRIGPKLAAALGKLRLLPRP
ncbi:putative polysaccharide biosynthesis protein [Paenibacillus pinistramenti]|uniref:putative polysaccharide biosynthesis protein n=1 Tax=Paenibacillus pinistramenti TaxID=1768003 RepID=UPI001108E31F|nr:polysaccharide biosynthesis protein [Paenibacillus pinistramenti]